MKTNICKLAGVVAGLLSIHLLIGLGSLLARLGV